MYKKFKKVFALTLVLLMTVGILPGHFSLDRMAYAAVTPTAQQPAGDGEQQTSYLMPH